MLQYPILTIAGLDNSGAAGMLADIKTFSAFGCYGMTALTLVAVQNTLGVQKRLMIDTPTIKHQIDVIFEDLRPKAIKIGILIEEDVIHMVADYLEEHAQDIPIVLDPVMMLKNNHPMLSPSAIQATIKRLIPLATIITPNLPEAMVIIGEDPAKTTLPQIEIAKRILDMGIKSAIIKGGHYSTEDSTDIFVEQGKEMIFLATTRVNTPHTHGTGCTLSAAIVASLAQGRSLETSVRRAKKFITKALESTIISSLGSGVGPVDHNWFREDIPDYLEI